MSKRDLLFRYYYNYKEDLRKVYNKYTVPGSRPLTATPLSLGLDTGRPHRRTLVETMPTECKSKPPANEQHNEAHMQRAASQAPSDNESSTIRPCDHENLEHKSTVPSIIAAEPCSGLLSSTTAQTARLGTDAIAFNDHQLVKALRTSPPESTVNKAMGQPIQILSILKQHIVSFFLNLWNTALFSFKTDQAQTALQLAGTRAPLIYSPLTGREIRLITISDGDDETCISCTLSTVSLTDSPEFVALSYSWGDPKLKQPILVNGQPFDVTVNLELALQRLRRLHPNRGIWIDALCINQEDTTEKETQLPFMESIYSQASCVYSFDLFLRPWWTRTWTLQEILLARHAIFLIGNYTVEWEEMQSWISWFGLSVDELSEPGPWGMFSYKHFSAKYDPDAPFKFQKLNEAVNCAVRIAEDKGTYTSSNFGTLLMSTAAREVSDPRDKVYALLGLVSDAERAKIAVTYKIPRMEVYHQVIKSFWPTWPAWFYFDFFHFFRLADADSNSTVPSWVFDFSSSWHGPAPLIPFVTANTRWIGPHQESLQLSLDGRVLNMLVTPLCEIQHQHGIPESPEDDAESFANSVQQTVFMLSNARSMSSTAENSLYPLEALRKKELPLQMMGLSDLLLIETGRFTSIDLLSRLEAMNQYFEREVRNSTAAELAGMLQPKPNEEGRAVAVRMFLQAISRSRRGAYFFATKHGFAGMSPVQPAMHDCIVLPHVAKCFLLLRPTTTGSYRIVAPVYVSGLMDFAELKKYHDQGILRDKVVSIV
ncbi:heterokaryon incompatibility protein-domain-containing protein [Apiosordaria backusii]|uniref:Heterokaryon incompatibility protein-domain-containing protein n=1 Tax=Apiosordaria backusii TaxID=314023 RepID=A0AA40ESS0_9PEZI|nr:heterokaryon incompatibility protein-domain-containing protein [Apiosordaria backusii]